MHRFLLLTLSLLALSAFGQQDTLTWKTEILANASSGEFAPYMIGSWKGGRIINGNGAWAEAAVEKPLNLSRRFSWAAGVDILGGHSSPASYERYDGSTNTWYWHKANVSNINVQELYGQIKYRGVHILAGMKERESVFIDQNLSMGDLVRSNNAAPIPCLTTGFINFQNIPFTKGFIQIYGELTYGKFYDNSAIDQRFNYYHGLLVRSRYFSYKSAYFRVNPKGPFSVIVGVQNSGLFGGSTDFYNRGQLTNVDNRGFRLANLWHMFFPHNTGEANAIGQSMGSWDFRANYRLTPSHQVSAYFQWYWEDGSGIGRRNGWDGLWGLQYSSTNKSWLDGAVFEYLDFTNQAGPVHYAPNDYPGSTITQLIGGADDNYNNDRYGPYANYGMSIGTPFLKSPIYNTDGYWAFAHCRTRGFHAAVTGHPLPSLSYTAKISMQRAWGEGRQPAASALDNFSAGLSTFYLPAKSAFSYGVELGLDRGSLRGNNFGTLFTMRYSGSLIY